MVSQWQYSLNLVCENDSCGLPCLDLSEAHKGLLKRFWRLPTKDQVRNIIEGNGLQGPLPLQICINGQEKVSSIFDWHEDFIQYLSEPWKKASGQITNLVCLGAGASLEYGYPTGEGLVYDLFDKNKEYSVITFPQLQELRKFISPKGIETIDEVIMKANAGQKSDIVYYAKLFLAESILRSEVRSKLWRSIEDSSFSNNHLYKYIYKRYSGPATSKEEVRKNRKTLVISFNYDRSFKSYIVGMISNNLLLPEEEAVQLFKETFNYQAIYGTYDYENARHPPVPYGEWNYEHDYFKQEVEKFARTKIKAISELDDDNINFKEGILTLNQSLPKENTHFLGMAFHEENIKSIIPAKQSTLIRGIATNFKVTPLDLERKRRAYP